MEWNTEVKKNELDALKLANPAYALFKTHGNFVTAKDFLRSAQFLALMEIFQYNSAVDVRSQEITKLYEIKEKIVTEERANNLLDGDSYKNFLSFRKYARHRLLEKREKFEAYES